MAVIGSIRKHSTFLVIIIGVALAAFVLGDFTNKGANRITNVGTVDGEDISILDFNQKVEQNIAGTKQQQNKQNLTQEEIFKIKEDTWNQMVRQTLMQKEYDELGLSVTADELFDLVQGPNPHPLMKQYFVNPNTGQFDRNVVINYLQNLDNMGAESKQQWLQLEEYIKNDQLRNKYNALIAKGFYVPKPLAYANFSEENDVADVEYVAVKFADVNDTDVKVTDADYKKYYDKNKSTFEQKAQVDLEFVTFEVKPSIEDLAAARKEMNEIYEEFKITTNIPRFVAANSDNAYDSSWFAQGQLPVQIDSVLFNSQIGTVIRPFLENNTFYTARLVDVASRPDSLKASHILISFAGALRADPAVTRSKDQARRLADSLFTIASKSQKTFGELAIQHSNDPTAAKNQGDLGWFADGTMVYAFNEAVVNGKVGDIVMAETVFGFHIIEITGKTPVVNKVRAAIISRQVIASTETFQQIFASASKIASEAKTKIQFDKAIEDGNLTKRKADKINLMSDYIPGLTNARQIIRWAFNEDTKLNEVSEVFDLDNMFVVAIVTNRTEDGIPPLDEAMKTRINSFVMSEVKGNHLKEQMKSLNNNPDQIVSTLKGVKGSMNNLTFSARNLQGYATENEVIGAVFGMKPNQQTEPIVGKAGVFIIKLNDITKAPAQNDYMQGVNMMQNAFKGRVDQDIPYRAIENETEVKDNRLIFY